MQEMVQELLADRFGLKFHRDRRELPVYALQIATGGPKLTSAKHPEAEADEESSGQGAAELSIDEINISKRRKKPTIGLTPL